MKRILLVLFSFFAVQGFAQPQGDYTAYDCNGNSKNLYATLASGKSVIVAHKGVDCGICINSAPGWQTWAAANTNKVDVWGAITYTYNPNQFTTANMCSRTASWKNTHGWNDIFTFPDSTRLWVNFSSPRYYVYSAIDSSLVYQGPSSSTARNMAIAQSTVGIQDNLLRGSKFIYTSGQLTIENLNSAVQQISVFSISGKLVAEYSTNSTRFNQDVSNLGKGIFVLQVRDNQGSVNNKKVVFH